jgi:hypothetical protein
VGLVRWTRRQDRLGGVRFVDALPIALGVAVASSVALGISPRAIAVVGHVHFNVPELADGQYAFLGAEDGIVYLVPCAGDTHLVRVREELVVSLQLVDVVRPPNPSIADVVSGRTPLRLGFVPGCPQP